MKILKPSKISRYYNDIDQKTSFGLKFKCPHFLSPTRRDVGKLHVTDFNPHRETNSILKILAPQYSVQVLGGDHYGYFFLNITVTSLFSVAMSGDSVAHPWQD